MKYGTTKKKIAHIIVEGSGNGLADTGPLSAGSGFRPPVFLRKYRAMPGSAPNAKRKLRKRVV